MRRLSFIALVGVIFGLIFSMTVAYADTVNLTNGRTIDALNTAAKSDPNPESDPRTRQIPEGKTRLLYSNGGQQDIPSDEIDSIEENDKDAFSN